MSGPQGQNKMQVTHGQKKQAMFAFVSGKLYIWSELDVKLLYSFIIFKEKKYNFDFKKAEA